MIFHKSYYSSTYRIANISCKTSIMTIFFSFQCIFYNIFYICRIRYIGKSMSKIICSRLNSNSSKSKDSTKKSLRILNIINFI